MQANWAKITQARLAETIPAGRRSLPGRDICWGDPSNVGDHWTYLEQERHSAKHAFRGLSRSLSRPCQARDLALEHGLRPGAPRRRGTCRGITTRRRAWQSRRDWANFKVMEAPISWRGPESWQVWVPAAQILDVPVLQASELPTPGHAVHGVSRLSAVPLQSLSWAGIPTVLFAGAAQ